MVLLMFEFEGMGRCFLGENQTDSHPLCSFCQTLALHSCTPRRSPSSPSPAARHAAPGSTASREGSFIRTGFLPYKQDPKTTV